MVAHETMIRIKPQVWEMIQFEKRLGESMSKVIERVFQERFDDMKRNYGGYEQKKMRRQLQKAWEGEKNEAYGNI